MKQPFVDILIARASNKQAQAETVWRL